MPVIPRTKNAQLSAKIEATFSSVSAGDVLAGFNPTFKPNIEENKDESIRESFGKYPVIAGGTSSDLGYSWYLKGSGVAGDAPECDAVLKMCGMRRDDVAATSNTYHPDTSQDTPGSATHNVDGKYLHIVEGSYGNLKIAGESGKLAAATADFKGAFVTPTATALVGAVTYDPTSPRPLKSVALVILDSSDPTLFVKSFSFDFGANLPLIESMASASAYAGAAYTDRDIKGQIMLVAPDLATLDAYTAAFANTQGVFSFAWGPTGNALSIEAGFGVIGQVTPSDENGVLRLALEIQASLPGGEAEGNDFALGFA